MKTWTNTLFALALVTSLMSCRGDENFSVGWTDYIVEENLSLSTSGVAEITLATINPEDMVADYMAENKPDHKWYEIDEMVTMSGNVTNTEVLPLDDIIEFDIFAVTADQEVLIGEMRDGVAQQATFGLDGSDVDLADLANGEEIDLVLRYRVVEDPLLDNLNVFLNLNSRLLVNGAK